VVTSPPASKTVFFDRGFVVFASSNLTSDSLGERLIRAGRISRHELDLVGMLMKGGKRTFRQSLVLSGIVSEEELGRHVAAQVNGIVLSLFSAKEGTYSFTERPCTIPLELMVSLSAHRILIEGIRHMSSGKLILAGLPPLRTKVKLVEEPPFTLDVDKLRPVEKAVLRSAREGASIGGIVNAIGGDKGKVLRACYSLYASGVMEAATDVRARPRRVQEETGTFVVSEILRKIGVAPESESAPAAPAPPDQTPEVAPSPMADEPRALADEPPVPLQETADERPSPEEVTTPPGQGRWARAISGAIDWVRAWWNDLVSQKAVELDAERPADTEAYEPHAVNLQEGEAPQTHLEPAGGEDSATESVGVPSWSVMDDPGDEMEPSSVSEEEAQPEPQEEEPVDESLGVPRWSVRDDPSDVVEPTWDSYEEVVPEPQRQEPVVESLGVPSWSIKDDEGESPEASPVSQEELEASPISYEELEASPVSYQEEEAQAEEQEPEIVLKIEDEWLAPSGAQGDLLIELEPEDETERSMLSPIPMEEIELDEESPELVIMVEQEAFGDIPESAEDLSSLLGGQTETPPAERDGQAKDPPKVPKVTVSAIAPPPATTPSRSLGEDFFSESNVPPKPSAPPTSTAQPKSRARSKSRAQPKRSAPPKPSAPPTSTAQPKSRARSKSRAQPKRGAPPEPSAPPEIATPPDSTAPPARDEAASPTEQATRAHPKQEVGGEARLLRDVKLHFKVRDWEGAVRLLEQLVEISPSSALYRGMLGRAMSRHPRLRNNAEKHFIEALRLSPQAPDLHYWLGLYYKSFGLKSRAFNEFRTTLRIDPQHEGARKQLSGGKRDESQGGVLKKLFGG
jgi:hypothetical protein